MLYPSLQERLNTQHLAIAEIIKPVTDEQLQQRPPTGKWSVQENLAHLAAYQPVFLQRLHLMLDNDDPVFPRYVGDDDPAFLHWRTQPRQALLEEIAAGRAAILALLAQVTTPQLARKGSHAVYGTCSLQDWTEMFLLHEAHHLYTVFRLVHFS